jgi:hypothetical protein
MEARQQPVHRRAAPKRREMPCATCSCTLRQSQLQPHELLLLCRGNLPDRVARAEPAQPGHGRHPGTAAARKRPARLARVARESRAHLRYIDGLAMTAATGAAVSPRQL